MASQHETRSLRGTAWLPTLNRTQSTHHGIYFVPSLFPRSPVVNFYTLANTLQKVCIFLSVGRRLPIPFTLRQSCFGVGYVL